MDLTRRQQEIFDFIRRYSAKYGYPPTVRDIGKAVGLASSSTVHAHLANLEKIGLLRRDPSKPRAIELLERGVGSAVDSVKGMVRAEGLPLLGSVAAGQPILAEENIEEYVPVPQLAGGEEGDYVLRIRGESMKEAGILEGDYVVVHPQDTANDGDVIVALLGEEATVKRFFREPDHIRLQPENDTMEPIRSKEVKVLGRVVGCSGGCEPAGRVAHSPVRAGASLPPATAVGWRYRVRCRPGSRGGLEPSRKVRTSQSKVVELSTRGNPRESATETHRPRPPSHVNGGTARVKWCGKSAPASR